MSQKQMFAFRLSEDAIAEMEEIAAQLYIPVRTMARQWIMQRLDAIGKEKEHAAMPETNLAGTCRRVRLQRTPSGKLIGAAVMINVRMLERYVTAGTEYLDVEMIPLEEGILLKIVEV